MAQRFLIVRKVHSGKHLTFYSLANIKVGVDLRYYSPLMIRLITGSSKFELIQIIIKNPEMTWSTSQNAELGDILSIPPGTIIPDVDIHGEQSRNKRGIPSYLLAPSALLPAREMRLEHWKFELGSKIIQTNSILVASLCRSWTKGHCMPDSHFRKTCIFRHVFLDVREQNSALERIETAKMTSKNTLLENYDEDDPHNESKQGKASSG
jgi:hypothetical protein